MSIVKQSKLLFVDQLVSSRGCKISSRFSKLGILVSTTVLVKLIFFKFTSSNKAGNLPHDHILVVVVLIENRKPQILKDDDET